MTDEKPTFYDLMQAYRSAPFEDQAGVHKAFHDVKNFVMAERKRAQQTLDPSTLDTKEFDALLRRMLYETIVRRYGMSGISMALSDTMEKITSDYKEESDDHPRVSEIIDTFQVIADNFERDTVKMLSEEDVDGELEKASEEAEEPDYDRRDDE